jgi:hypothetical protein
MLATSKFCEPELEPFIPIQNRELEPVLHGKKTLTNHMNYDTTLSYDKWHS